MMHELFLVDEPKQLTFGFIQHEESLFQPCNYPDFQVNDLMINSQIEWKVQFKISQFICTFRVDFIQFNILCTQ